MYVYSYFLCTKLCTAWNYAGKILIEISVCTMLAKTFYHFSIWILWSSLAQMGKQKLPSWVLPRRLFLIIQIPLLLRLSLSPPFKFYPALHFPHPLPHIPSPHLTQNQMLLNLATRHCFATMALSWNESSAGLTAQYFKNYYLLRKMEGKEKKGTQRRKEWRNREELQKRKCRET